MRSPAARQSDLGTRIASGAVMLAVAGICFALGGLWLDGLILLVACAALWEFILLVDKITDNFIPQFFAVIAGAIYISVGAADLMIADLLKVLAIVGAVICVDVFAYAFGRSIGGPKIAPRISPSKTWAGLLGGIVGASLFFVFFEDYAAISILPKGGASSFGPSMPFFLSDLPKIVLLGTLVAVIAQAGDFSESWLKRRAGVKDSSRLIPGHGGVFDRVDGLLAVAFADGLANFVMVGN